MLTFRFNTADGIMIETETLTSGMVGKCVKLEFSSDWDNLQKTAVFVAGPTTKDVLNVTDEVVIPHEVLQNYGDRLYVGIYGVDGDGTITPTIYARGPRILRGADPSGDESAEASPPVWAQLQAQIDDLMNGGTGGGSGLGSTQNSNLSDYAKKTPEIVGTTIGETAMAFSHLMHGTEKVESFIFFADPHFLNSINNESQMREYLDSLKLYYDVTPTDFVIGGGDWYGNSDTYETACFKLGYIDGWMHRLFGDKYYPAVGNHDTNQQGVDETVGTWTGILSKETVRNLWFREHGNTYYAFDGLNTRFYVLDTWKEGADASYYWEQIAWLGEKLKTDNAENSALVLHMGYYPLSGGGFGVNTLAANALALGEAFNNATSITLNGVSYDFTECTGKVRFALSGHIHADYATIVKGIPLIATTHMRDGNTPTFDLCLADCGANKLHLVRVGTGESRQFTMGPDGAILDGTEDDSGNDVVTTYTNLVPTATTTWNSTEICNGIGYQDNAYVSTDGFGSAEGYVAVGFLALNDTDVIYIKGAEIVSEDKVRLYVTSITGGTKYACKAPSLSDGYFADTAGTQRFTIEQLGDLYYRLTPVQSANDASMYYRISLKGTGANLVITHNEPIVVEDDPYTLKVADPIVFLNHCNHSGGGINYYDKTVRALIATTENTGATFAVTTGTTDTTHYALVKPDGATSITVNCGSELMWAVDRVDTAGYLITSVTNGWCENGETADFVNDTYYLIKLKKADDSAFAADYDYSGISWTFA